MRSRTLSCEKAIFGKELKRFWPLWAAYLAILLLLMPVLLQSSLTRASNVQYSFLSCIEALPYIALISSVIMVCLTAMAVFSFQYTSRSANFSGALPVTRGRLFLSHYFSGLFWQLAATAVSYLLMAAVAALHGVTDIGIIFEFLALHLMELLFFFGFGAFCSVLTGHVIVMPLVYAVLNFTVYVAQMLVGEIISMLTFGVESSFNVHCTVFSPAVFLAEHIDLSFIDEATGKYSNIWRLIHDEAPVEHLIPRLDGLFPAAMFAVAGIVFAVLAVLIFRRRQLETAGDVVAIRILRPIFRYCLSFGCAITIGVGLYAIVFSFLPGTEAVKLAICMCFGAFIGCLAAEMLMQKSFRVWKKILPALIIAIVVICAFITACELDLFGIERYVPEVSEVEKVTIDDTEVSLPENIEAVTALHGSIIANKERYDAREIDWTDFDWSGVSSHYFRISYCLKNGREVERCYTIYFTEEEWNTPDTDANVLENVLNSREAIYNRKKTSIPVTEEYITSATVSRSSLDDYSDVKLTPAEGAELYACIVRDMDECTIGRMWIFCGDEYDKTVYQSTINIELRKGNGINDDSEWDNFWTTPTKNSVHTNEFLEHHGIELYTWSELNQNAVIENDSVYYG